MGRRESNPRPSGSKPSASDRLSPKKRALYQLSYRARPQAAPDQDLNPVSLAVPKQGFEPRFPSPKPGVLPLDDFG